MKKSVPDHDRPLSERGITDAARMGKILRDADLTPDRIISSTAERARNTAEMIAKSSGYEEEVVLSRDLYLADSETYRDVVRGVSDAYHCVLVVGHNPGVEVLLETLTGNREMLSPASLARVRLAIEHWSEIDAGATAELIDLWRPQ